MKQLVDAGKVTKTVEKKKSYFEIAKTIDEDEEENEDNRITRTFIIDD